MKSFFSKALVLGCCVSTSAVYADNDNIEEEVIVTSSRIGIAPESLGTSVSVLTSDDINLRGYTSVADLLRTQVGIGVSNSGGAGKQTSLRIRGEEGYRTLVFVDGIEVSDPTGTQVGPQMQHLSATNGIERIEVLRGTQGFIYGADAGGVINIISKRASDEMGAQLKLEAGSNNSYLINQNAFFGNDTFDAFLTLSKDDTDGFNTRADDLQMDDDGYENTTVHGKFGVTPTEQLRVELVVRNVNADNEFDGCFLGDNDCLGEFEQTNARLSANYQASAVEHQVAYGYTDVERASFAAGNNSFSTEGEIKRIEYIGTAEPSGAFKLVYGVDFEEEDIVSSSGDDFNRDQLGTYLDVYGEMSDRLFLTAGLRHDDNEDFGETLNGRLSVAYLQPIGDKTVKFRASYGTGFRAPSLSEIAYNLGPFAFGQAAQTPLDEETSKGYEAAVEFDFNGTHIELVYFDQDVENEIFFDLIGYTGYLQADGNTNSKGIEFIYDVPLNEEFSILGNFTFNETDNADNVQRARRPEQLANIGIHWQPMQGQLKLLANMRISRNSVNDVFGVGRVELDDYQVLDLSASYQLNDKFEIYLRGKNVTDEDYQEVTGFNTDGTSVYAGLRYDF